MAHNVNMLRPKTDCIIYCSTYSISWTYAVNYVEEEACFGNVIELA